MITEGIKQSYEKPEFELRNKDFKDRSLIPFPTDAPAPPPPIAPPSRFEPPPQPLYSQPKAAAAFPPPPPRTAVVNATYSPVVVDPPPVPSRSPAPFLGNKTETVSYDTQGTRGRGRGRGTGTGGDGSGAGGASGLGRGDFSRPDGTGSKGFGADGNQGGPHSAFSIHDEAEDGSEDGAGGHAARRQAPTRRPKDGGASSPADLLESLASFDSLSSICHSIGNGDDPGHVTSNREPYPTGSYLRDDDGKRGDGGPKDYPTGSYLDFYNRTHPDQGGQGSTGSSLLLLSHSQSHSLFSSPSITF